MRYVVVSDGTVVEDTLTGKLFGFSTTDAAVQKCAKMNEEWENQLLESCGLANDELHFAGE